MRPTREAVARPRLERIAHGQAEDVEGWEPWSRFFRSHDDDDPITVWAEDPDAAAQLVRLRLVDAPDDAGLLRTGAEMALRMNDLAWASVLIPRLLPGLPAVEADTWEQVLAGWRSAGSQLEFAAGEGEEHRLGRRVIQLLLDHDGTAAEARVDRWRGWLQHDPAFVEGWRAMATAMDAAKQGATATVAREHADRIAALAAQTADSAWTGDPLAAAISSLPPSLQPGGGVVTADGELGWATGAAAAPSGGSEADAGGLWDAGEAPPQAGGQAPADSTSATTEAAGSAVEDADAADDDGDEDAAEPTLDDDSSAEAAEDDDSQDDASAEEEPAVVDGDTEAEPDGADAANEDDASDVDAASEGDDQVDGNGDDTDDDLDGDDDDDDLDAHPRMAI